MPEKPKISKHLDYSNSQVFGCEESSNHVDKEDIITQIQFDRTGQFLAVGDNAGRIIMFKLPEDDTCNQRTSNQQFDYYSEFQSHQPEFDSLKSMTISESIKSINWLRPQGKYNKMITANANRIKLWKLFEKEEKKVILSGQRDSLTDLAIPQLNKEMSFTSHNQCVFPIKHSGSINNVEVTNNEQYVFSTDQNRAILWDLEHYEHPFVLYDTPQERDSDSDGSSNSIKSGNEWKLGEEIRCSKFHPTSDSIFAIATNKARIQMSDIRVGLNDRKNISFVNELESTDKKNYFTEMTNSVCSLDFLSDGKYMVSRDYLGIKVWDVCRPDKPLKKIQNNQMLQEKLCHLFENDCMQDSFKINSIGNSVISGNYDNRFNVMDILSGQNIQYKLSFNQEKKVNGQKPPSLVTNLCHDKNSFRHSSFDHNKKILTNGVHKQSNKIALATLNSFFIYSKS